MSGRRSRERAHARIAQTGEGQEQRMQNSRNWRGRYRQMVSVLFIPLGMIMSLRALWLGWQAWTLVLLGLAFVALGVVRLQLLPLRHLAPARQRRGGPSCW
ncbi:TMEM128 family protein [Thermogemmatispora carboxidivorans]|uniref:TMEM128 family protein n=1 Tax=Thermogemmatispora carboxidivorans TaxID=1382306 RepID=UPI00069B842C|nr:TMEM128 family protein [Thermogemmatispora carboxidivorans]